MSDLREYGNGIVRDLEPPDFADLVRVSRRRRTIRNAAVTGPAVGALVVALVLGTAGQRRASEVPATTPVPTTTATAWTAAEVIAGGSVVEKHTYDDGSGAEVRNWRRCAADWSVVATDGMDVVQNPSCRTAIEVTWPNGRRMALATGTRLMGRTTTYVGDGTFLVDGGDQPGALWLISPSRDAPKPVTEARDMVPPDPGTAWVAGPECPCTLDRASATLSRIALPGGVEWARSTSGGFWGIWVSSNQAGDRQSFVATWVDADGPGGDHVLTDDQPSQVTLADGGRAGEMAFYEQSLDGSQPGAPTLLHISTDRGVTWQIRVVPPSEVADGLVTRGQLAPTWRAWAQAPLT